MSICILRLKNPNSHKFCHQSTHLRESHTPAVTGGRRAAGLFHGSVLFVPDHSVLVLAPQRFIAVNQPLGLLLFRHSDPPIGHHALPAYGSSAIAHARISQKLNVLRSEAKQFSNKSNVDKVLEKTNYILALLEKAEPLSQFDEEIFLSMIEKIEVGQQCFSFKLLNGLLLKEDR